MTAGFVRAARPSDAAALARVQVASWRASLAGLVPDAVVAELTSPGSEKQWAERWREAITAPPTSRHRVHVAVTSTGAARADALGPVGFASAGPATDADLWPGTDAELYELHVLPDLAGPHHGGGAEAGSPEPGGQGHGGQGHGGQGHGGQGHGGRLLHAVADTLAEDGFHTAYTWALSADGERLTFLESAGWAPDGCHSNLDMGVKVHVVRLHCSLRGQSPPRPPTRGATRPP